MTSCRELCFTRAPSQSGWHACVRLQAHRAEAGELSGKVAGLSAQLQQARAAAAARAADDGVAHARIMELQVSSLYPPSLHLLLP